MNIKQQNLGVEGVAGQNGKQSKVYQQIVMNFYNFVKYLRNFYSFNIKKVIFKRK